MIVFFLFRVLTEGPESSSLAQKFIAAMPGSVWNQIYENNMDNQSLVTEKEGVQTVISGDKLLTVFAYVTGMFKNSEPCEVKVLWKSPKKSHLSIAFPKGQKMKKQFVLQSILPKNEEKNA